MWARAYVCVYVCVPYIMSCVMRVRACVCVYMCGCVCMRALDMCALCVLHLN